MGPGFSRGGMACRNASGTKIALDTIWRAASDLPVETEQELFLARREATDCRHWLDMSPASLQNDLKALQGVFEIASER
jgi:hypothetical protein